MLDSDKVNKANDLVKEAILMFDNLMGGFKLDELFKSEIILAEDIRIKLRAACVILNLGGNDESQDDSIGMSRESNGSG